MKKLLMYLCVFFCLSSADAQLSKFAGNWKNIDMDNPGMTRVEIDISGSKIKVKAWGKCTPQDCYWGEVEGIAYASSVADKLSDSALAITATFIVTWKKTSLVITLQKDATIKVDTFSQFLKDSRTNYTTTEFFVLNTSEAYSEIKPEQEEEKVIIGSATGKKHSVQELKQAVMLYLPFDGNLVDRSAKVLKVQTPKRDLQFAQGIKGQGIFCDGSSTEIKISNFGRLPISDEMTIELWVKLKDWKNPYKGSPSVESIISHSTIFGISSDYRDYKLRGYIQTDTMKTHLRLQGDTMTTNQWHHVALVYCGKEEKVKLYLDGQQVAEESASGKLLLNPQLDLVIGTWYKQNQAFCGTLDELVVYNIALSAEEIGNRATAKY